MQSSQRGYLAQLTDVAEAQRVVDARAGADGRGWGTMWALLLLLLMDVL